MSDLSQKIIVILGAISPSTLEEIRIIHADSEVITGEEALERGYPLTNYDTEPLPEFPELKIKKTVTLQEPFISRSERRGNKPRHDQHNQFNRNKTNPKGHGRRNHSHRRR